GGDSLLVVHLLFDVSERFGPRLPLRTVYEAPTIRQLAAVLSGDPGAESPPQEGELERAEADARSIESLPAAAAATSAGLGGGSVLVPGATGFVGAHLVATLLERTDTNIVYLARDASAAAASARLRDALGSYRIWDDSFAVRLRPVSGDLASEGLGL